MLYYLMWKMPTNCSPLTRQIKEKNLQIACFQISALPPMIILIAYSMYGSTKFRFDIFWCVCVSLLRIVADSIKSFFPLLRRTVYDNHSRLLVTSRKESIAHNLFAKKGNEMVGKKEKEKEKEKEKVSPMSNHRPSRV